MKVSCVGLGKSTRAPSAQEPSALEPAPAQCVKEMSHSLFFLCVCLHIGNDQDTDKVQQQFCLVLTPWLSVFLLHGVCRLLMTELWSKSPCLF